MLVGGREAAMEEPLVAGVGAAARGPYRRAALVAAGLACIASLASLALWASGSQEGAMFPVPTSVEHANEILQSLAPMDERELYDIHVSPHLATMYKQFLEFYGSTAPGFVNGDAKVHELDSESFARGLSVFKETVREVIKLNFESYGQTDRAIFGITQYSDWSEDERQRVKGAKWEAPKAPLAPPAFGNATDTDAALESPLLLAGACHDTSPQSSCRFWKSKGYCQTGQRFFAFVNAHCKATCANSNCEFWKGQGYCAASSKYHLFMQKTCACACENTNQKVCTDVDDARNCQFWKGKGFCQPGQRYHAYVSQHCQATCGENCHHVRDVGKSRNWAATYPEAFEVRQQGACGSCWAHSTTEMLRQMWAVNHLGGETGKLSVQYLVDCVYPTAGPCNAGVQGCCGGLPSHALDFVHHAGGIPTQSAYGSYQSGSANFVRHSCRHVAPTVTTAGPLTLNGELQMRTKLIRDGSLGVLVWADNSWQQYAGGVLQGRACTPPAGGPPIDHAVQLVGYDDSKKAWLVQNSWGTSWGVTRNPPYRHVPGQSGFILIKYGRSMCHIDYMPVFALGVSKVAAAADTVLSEAPPPEPRAIDLEAIEIRPPVA